MKRTGQPFRAAVEREKGMLLNIAGAFVIRGASMVLSFFTMPAYLRYFENDAVLGVWFTMLSILNWIYMFDLGIGNGLRNKLAASFASGDRKRSRQYISSAYFALSAIAAALAILYACIQRFLDWNRLLNITADRLDSGVLSVSMNAIIAGILLQFILGLSAYILYAMQRPAVNYLMTLVSNFLIFLYVSLAPTGDLSQNLLRLSAAYLVLSNLPYLAATGILFLRPLRGLHPTFASCSRQAAREVLDIGLILLWLQIAAMVALSTHAFFITNLIAPEAVVEYNAYFKVYNLLASLLALALSPIWSAVTKAQTERNYGWIQKLYRLLLCFPAAVTLLDLLMIPFLQWGFNWWLGAGQIDVRADAVAVMTLFNTLYVLHNVNTSVNNGLSYFKPQCALMTLAAVLVFPLSALLCRVMGRWTGVIAACCLALLPYELAQPFFTMTYLNRKQENGADDAR